MPSKGLNSFISSIDGAGLVILFRELQSNGNEYFTFLKFQDSSLIIKWSLMS